MCRRFLKGERVLQLAGFGSDTPLLPALLLFISSSKSKCEANANSAKRWNQGRELKGEFKGEIYQVALQGEETIFIHGSHKLLEIYEKKEI